MGNHPGCERRDGVRTFAQPRCENGPRLLGNSPSYNRSATGYSLANEATARLVALAWKPLITGDGDRIAPWEHRLIGWAKPIITRRPRPAPPPPLGRSAAGAQSLQDRGRLDADLGHDGIP